VTKKPRKLDGPSAGDIRRKQQGEALWKDVTKTITPLGDRPAVPVIKPLKMLGGRLENTSLPMEWYREEGHGGDSVGPPPTLDRKTRRRISKGRQEVDRSVDLHGLTQDQAYSHLKSVVEGAIRRGDKTLLVVTGKGGARFSQTGQEVPVAQRTRADFNQFGGVLKRMVPVWLEEPALKPFIISYGEASQEHGGEGAMYILLRSRTPGSRRRRPRDAGGKASNAKEKTGKA
jgi:DNA-nicking Smr family endonuclease